MSFHKKFSFFLLFCFLFLMVSITLVLAQKKKLTYQQVYLRGEPRLTGQLQRIQGWLDDSHYLESKNNSPDEKAKPKLMKVNAVTGEATQYFDFDKYKEKLPKGFSLGSSSARTHDYTGFLFNHKNDLYYFCTKTEKFKRLTANVPPEKNPKLSPNGKWVAFTREHNLFALEIENGLEHQLTYDGSDVVYNGWASWVYYEEILGRRSRYAAFYWSPNSQKIAFLRFDDSNVPKFPLYRADGVHGELEIERYPKPGDPNPDVKLGIVDLSENKTVWIDTKGDSKQYVAWPFWTPDSKQLFFQWLNRGQNNLKIYSADPETGKKTEIYNEKQSAWVDWFESIYFLKDGSGFIIRSDKDGWSHLYYYSMKGRLNARLTKGEWSVRGIDLVDENNKVIYFRRTLGNNLETHLYRVNLKGKNLTRLTTIAGNHRCQVSHTVSYFIDSYNNIQQPTKVDLYSKDGKLIRNLGDSKLAIMDEYDLGKVELFTIPSGDGFDLPAIWILPPDFDKTKKYPVLFRIYGGPASGTVSNSFQRMSGHFLAQNGIIFMSVDHRGSGHFGKKGVALMYRNLGKWEMHDYIAAVKWLRKKPFVDQTKIGISGGSYGGYTTCMALTVAANYFTHGIAASSVTDWKLYDTVYTERYMDTPQENPAGYDYGSVMTHAENYKGRLLITHGTMDDNVHMQNTIQFIDKLTDLNKDFELMLYPNARHGVSFPKRNHVSRESVQFWFKNFLGKDLVIN